MSRIFDRLGCHLGIFGFVFNPDGMSFYLKILIVSVVFTIILVATFLLKRFILTPSTDL